MKITAERLGVFNDAVIAIIVTVMALELPVRMNNGILDLPLLLGAIGIYFISFAIVASFWFELVTLLEGDEKLTQHVIIADVLLLFTLSLLPTLTKAMFEAIEWQTVLFFGLVISLTNILYYVVQVQVIRLREQRHGVPSIMVEFFNGIFLRHFIVMVILYGVGLAIAYFLPLIALILYVCTSIGGLFFNRSDEQGVKDTLKLPKPLMEKYLKLTPEAKTELKAMLAKRTSASSEAKPVKVLDDGYDSGACKLTPEALHNKALLKKCGLSDAEADLLQKHGTQMMQSRKISKSQKKAQAAS